MAVSLTVFAVAVTLGLVICVASATPTRNRVQTKLNVENDAPMMTRGHVCCGDLGCFDSGGDFYDFWSRPITSNPDCSLREKIKYHLNTRRNPQISQAISIYHTETIGSSYFDASKPTYILIHGFVDVFTSGAWNSMVREHLQREECNVIRVDWSDGNGLPYYQATANVRLVGAHAARLVHHLVTIYGVQAANVHFIGHSLGAHGSGYAGEALKKNYDMVLGRITGLDPAGLYFENLKPTVRLDPTDAAFVDTIVTDGQNILTNNAFGAALPMGHINFYPNGGLQQPGCGNNKAFLGRAFNGDQGHLTYPIDWKLVEEVIAQEVAASEFEDGFSTRGAIGCSHQRAPDLYYESINDEGCNITSFECDSYVNFQAGECFTCKDNKCAELGFRVDRKLASDKQKMFFSLTTGETPYCLVPHKITFQIQPKTPDNNSKKKTGFVYITLFGTQGQKKLQLTPSLIGLNPGQTYSFLFESPESLGFIHSMRFAWKDKESALNPGNWGATHFIWLEDNLTVTDVDENTVLYKASANKVQSGKDVVCTRQA